MAPSVRGPPKNSMRPNRGGQQAWLDSNSLRSDDLVKSQSVQWPICVVIRGVHPPEDGVWTVMGEDGRGGMSDAVAMGADELSGLLDVEVHSGDGLVARGSVPVADLWTVRT